MHQESYRRKRAGAGGAPEAVALVGVITIGVGYFAFDETGLLFAALRPVCASANKVVSFSI